MKKRNGPVSLLLPIVITFSLFLVFYSSIECKPTQAGFWLILALGASIGQAIARFSQRSSGKNQDNQ